MNVKMDQKAPAVGCQSVVLLKLIDRVPVIVVSVIILRTDYFTTEQPSWLECLLVMMIIHR